MMVKEAANAELPAPAPDSHEAERGMELTRRHWLTGGAILGAAALLGAAGAPAQAQTGTVGIDPAVDWKSIEQRLARRITMGMTSDDAARAKSIGFTAYLNEQLNATEANDTAVETYIKNTYPDLALSPKALLTPIILGANPTAAQMKAANDYVEKVRLELINATIYRSLNSTRQLLQRMVEFWSDHFNVSYEKPRTAKVVHDRDAIRANALTTFPAILSANIHNSAMLFYLDNTSNTVGGPNQNFARELLELHTLGVNSGYTQADVIDVARCFTGWGFDPNVNSATLGQFLFSQGSHDTGSKTVLGQTFNYKNQQDGETVISILANDPRTAAFISRKMIHWLLDPDPRLLDVTQKLTDKPALANLVATVTGVYQSTKGDIKAMIKAILTPTTLAAAPAKHKRPYHYLTSVFRTTHANLSGLSPLNYDLNNLLIGMGMGVFEWLPPNGYPDSIGYWGGLILPRLNFALLVGSNNQGSFPLIDLAGLTAQKSPNTIIQTLNTALYGGEMPTYVISDLGKVLAGSTAPTQKQVGEAVGLALSAYAFQWY